MWVSCLVFIVAFVLAIALSVWACCRVDVEKLTELADTHHASKKSQAYETVAGDEDPDEEGGRLARKTREDLVQEMVAAYDPAEDYDPSKTIVYKGKRLSVLETRILIDKLRHPEVRRRRVGGGFQNEVLNPETNMWMNADRYAKRYPFVTQLNLREILVDEDIGNAAAAASRKERPKKAQREEDA